MHVRAIHFSLFFAIGTRQKHEAFSASFWGQKNKLITQTPRDVWARILSISLVRKRVKWTEGTSGMGKGQTRFSHTSWDTFPSLLLPSQSKRVTPGAVLVMESSFFPINSPREKENNSTIFRLRKAPGQAYTNIPGKWFCFSTAQFHSYWWRVAFLLSRRKVWFDSFVSISSAQ